VAAGALCDSGALGAANDAGTATPETLRAKAPATKDFVTLPEARVRFIGFLSKQKTRRAPSGRPLLTGRNRARIQKHPQ